MDGQYNFADIDHEDMPDMVIFQTEMPPVQLSRIKAHDPSKFYSLIYNVTGVYATLLFLCWVLVRGGENAAIARACIMMTLFYMWLLWVIVYISQLNPLMSPVIEHTSLTWVASKEVRSLQ